MCLCACAILDVKPQQEGGDSGMSWLWKASGSPSKASKAGVMMVLPQDRIGLSLPQFIKWPSNIVLGSFRNVHVI